MIPVTTFAGKKLADFGLGKSGLLAAGALIKGGAEVVVFDDNAKSVAEAQGAGLKCQDLREIDWAEIAALVLSPGVPLTHPEPHWSAKLAHEAGVEVIGDIELFCRERAKSAQNCPFVAITGTNGKSTTTALTGALLRGAGIGVQVGGNIGLPILDLLPKPEEDLYVLELSSYQLDLSEQLSCSVAVILNLSADHLDRHGGMNGYLRAKRRILRNQRASDWALIGVDDAHGRALFEQLGSAGPQRLLPFAVGRRLSQGIYVLDGRLYDALDRGQEPATEPVVDLRPIASLRGAHNWQNAAAAYGVARALGVAPQAAAAGLRAFRGLAHRMEAVATQGGVAFVNDSKATNPEAAARALASFERIYWIAGGRPKEASLDPLLPWLDRVRHAYLIGEAAAPFAAALASRVPCTQSGDLATALRQAVGAARADREGAAVVLLSPACASFDQFADFEARGDAFKALVGSLAPCAPQPAQDGGGSPRAVAPAIVEAGR